MKYCNCILKTQCDYFDYVFFLANSVFSILIVSAHVNLSSDFSFAMVNGKWKYILTNKVWTKKQTILISTVCQNSCWMKT